MKKLRSFIILLFVIVASFFTTQGDLLPKDTTDTYVSRVVDGDTLVVSDRGESLRVRLIGVNTPETVHPNGIVEPWGKEASNFTKKSLEGQTVYLEYDEEEEDHYGRKLAYIWTEDPKTSEKSPESILFNYTLVREGYARERPYPPNTRHQRLLRRGEESAIEENAGLWAIEGDDGPAKGNKNSKLYHMPGDSQYDKISEKNIIYFQTAKDAERAGFQRALQR